MVTPAEMSLVIKSFRLDTFLTVTMVVKEA